MPTVSRYHPLLVALHWLIALSVIGALFIGLVVFDSISDKDPAKKTVIALHMAGGFTILLLMTLRLIVRLRTKAPPAMVTGNAAVDQIGPLIHLGFYVVVFAVIACGVVTSFATGLPAIVFGGSGAPLPDFDAFPVFQAHGLLAWILAAMVALHISAAIYHQVFRKDHLLRRMSFGPRE